MYFSGCYDMTINNPLFFGPTDTGTNYCFQAEPHGVRTTIKIKINGGWFSGTCAKRGGTNIDAFNVEDDYDTSYSTFDAIAVADTNDERWPTGSAVVKGKLYSSTSAATLDVPLHLDTTSSGTYAFGHFTTNNITTYRGGIYNSANAPNGIVLHAGSDPNFAIDRLQVMEVRALAFDIKNGMFIQERVTIADGDTTPDVSGGNIFVTSSNTGATAITDLDLPATDQIVYIIGGSNTNSSTIADSGNFNLSAGWTAGLDDVLVLWVQADNDYIELSRTDN